MASIQQNNDGTISINYNPRERGLHELTLSYNEKNVEGKIVGCFSCYAWSCDVDIRLHAYIDTNQFVGNIVEGWIDI